MTYCPECGSNVAELDIFCPYCGISINPTPLAGSSGIDEMASTIVMPLPPKKASVNAAPSDPPVKTPVDKAVDAEPISTEPAIRESIILPPPTPHLLAESGSGEAPALLPEAAAEVSNVEATSGTAEDVPPAAEPELTDETPEIEADQDMTPALPPDDVAEADVSGTTSPAPEGITAAETEIAEDGTLEDVVLETEPSATADVAAISAPIVEAAVESEDETADSPPPPEIEDVVLSDSLEKDTDEKAVSDPVVVTAPEETGDDSPADNAAFIAEEPASNAAETEAVPVNEGAELEVAGEESVADVSDVHDTDELFLDGQTAPDGTESQVDDQLLDISSESPDVPEPVSPDEIQAAAPTDVTKPEAIAAASDEPVIEPSDSRDEDVQEPISDAYFGAEPVSELSSGTAKQDEPEPTPVVIGETPAEPESAVVTADPLEAEFGVPLGQSASGRVLADAGTSPNIGTGGTDGRKSGLKPLIEGTLLNARYRITKKIGGGGMGAVYLASDLNLGGTQRAVKEMVQSHIEEEQQAKAVDDFKRESMILSTLDHPSIPTIYDYFYDEEESRFYLVMKYISGGDLASKLRATPEGRIDEHTVAEWALQIIDVLDYLHSLPTTIVYRDLKPSNVMIDGNTGRIMLIDFGIARSINQNLEKGVTAVGTMGYAPPELFSGQVEPRSDIYSLGSTMFHLLTGADPQNNPLLIFDFQKNPRPRQINPRLSDQIEKILMKAVEYSADARFSTAADMRRTMQEHLDNLLSGNVTYGVGESPTAVSLAFQMVFCGFCGQRIVATDLFCAFCGSKQPIAQQGVHSEIYSHGNLTARLVIEGTSDLTAPSYSIEKTENLVGRRDPMSNIFPEVDLSKYDPQTKISRRHARIWREGTAFLVEDLGSSNGTVLLSHVSDTLRLAPHQPHPLATGDRLRIGDTTLQFIVG